MLMCWKEVNGREATHNVLAEALMKARRTDLAEKVKHAEDNVKKRSVENKPSTEPATISSKKQRPTEEPSGNRSAVGDRDMTADMKEKKLQFVKELRKKYRNLCGGIKPVPFLRDKYDIDELFVESGIKFLKGKPRRGKEQEKWKKLTNYKTVFTDPQVKSNRHIIDGEPGYGKSTLFFQMTHDWCNETSPMNDVDILILLRLRQFKNVPSVYSAIKKFLLPKDSKLTEDDIKDILDSSSTLILLDGYDEYPGRGKRDNDIECIIRGEMFQNHDVILTTRTSCLPPDYSRDTKLFRLTGFDDTARDTYIRTVVAGGSSEDAARIKQFFRDNPVPTEISENPLLFAMISFMVYLHERFFNLKSITDFFRHIIKCFHSHDQIKVAQVMRQKELDHSPLDKLTFEELCGDSRKISWGKNELKSKIGKKLYNECLRIGLLIEEDGYDYYSMEYNTEITFYHMLFGEWFASHYLVKEATTHGAEFEPWLDSLLYDSYKEASMLQRLSSAITASYEKQLLNSMDPNYVYNMYRFACGLNENAAVKIIGLLAKEENYDNYTLLCITEWGGSFEKIAHTITSLCSRPIDIQGSDTILLQISSVELIKFASDRKIPIDSVGLYGCLDVGPAGNLRLKPSNLPLPVIDTTLKMLHIEEEGCEITEEETDSILQYSAMCKGLEVLQFFECLLPRYIKLTDSISLLRSRDVKVNWIPYRLNLESGQWEHYYGDGTPLTDEDYEEETVPKQWVEWKSGLTLLAERMKQCEIEDTAASSNELSTPSKDPKKTEHGPDVV